MGDFAREYHSRERVEWVQRLCCVVCGSGRGYCHNHHVRPPDTGTGRKSDYTTIVPLCPNCHDRYHTAGKLSLLQRASRNGGLKLLARRGGGWVAETYDQWEDCAAAVERWWQAVKQPRGGSHE